MAPAADPVALLRRDRATARERKDANANLCACATVAAGEPQLRMLVLREIDGRLALFVNRSSPKHGQFAESSGVQVLVYLPSLALQYRLTCRLAAIPAAIVHAHWRERPRLPRAQDRLYAEHPQSSPIASREWLREALASVENEEAVPDSAVGYYLLPQRVERLRLHDGDEPHDRHLYTLVDGGWRSEMLMP